MFKQEIAVKTPTFSLTVQLSSEATTDMNLYRLVVNESDMVLTCFNYEGFRNGLVTFA